MAYTESDLTNLDAAIASGQLIVQVENRRIEYRSMKELLQARAHVEAQIAAATAGASRRRAFAFRFVTSRGD